MTEAIAYFTLTFALALRNASAGFCFAFASFSVFWEIFLESFFDIPEIFGKGKSFFQNWIYPAIVRLHLKPSGQACTLSIPLYVNL
jgi:hypothetical protein